MKVLLDANIWIDIAARPSTFPDSARLFNELEAKGATICFPLSAYTTVYYIIRRALSDEAAQDFLMTLLRRGVKFLSFNARDVEIALSKGPKDHEDGCVAAICFNNSVNTLVTRNINDFKNVALRVATPEKMLKRLKNS